MADGTHGNGRVGDVVHFDHLAPLLLGNVHDELACGRGLVGFGLLVAQAQDWLAVDDLDARAAVAHEERDVENVFDRLGKRAGIDDKFEIVGGRFFPQNLKDLLVCFFCFFGWGASISVQGEMEREKKKKWKPFER